MKYRMYIDEVGNSDLAGSDNPNERFLCLTGVIIELTYVDQVAHVEIEMLKRKYFHSHPDEPVILHRKELVNRKPPFEALSDPQIEKSFNDDLLLLLHKLDFKVVAVTIDKLEHRKRYQVWRYDPYHYCLAILVERYVLWLNSKNRVGDVMAESRGGKEDRRLKDSFSRLYQQGTDFIEPAQFGRALTSKELKVKPKQNNITGLQIADLIAHPIYKEMTGRLLDTNSRNIFGTKVYQILQESKLIKGPRGQIEGWGLKWLP